MTSTGEVVSLAGSTMPTVTKPVPLVDWCHLKTHWKHLSDLPLKPSSGQVDVLLGLDHGELMMVLESRGGRHGEPFASRTRLGLIVRGDIRGDVRSQQLRVSLTRTIDVGDELGTSMNDALKHFFGDVRHRTSSSLHVTRKSTSKCDAERGHQEAEGGIRGANLVET